MAHTITLNSIKDVNFDEFVGNLKGNNLVTSMQITERFFGLGIAGFVAPTPAQLKQLLQAISLMEALEELRIKGTVHKLMIPGSTLALAIAPTLLVLHVNKGVSFENVYEVKALAKAIEKHQNLKELTICNFVVHARDHGDDDPLLEPLMKAAISLEGLQVLELECLASHRPWKRAFVNVETLVSLCHLPNLKRLGLAKLYLEGEHFVAIGRELLNNTNVSLQELCLNDNRQDDEGFEAMAKVLEKNRTIRRMSIYNNDRMSDDNFALVKKALESNNIIGGFEANVNAQQRSTLKALVNCNGSR